MQNHLIAITYRNASGTREMTKDRRNIHQAMNDMMGLATAYAEDGAFHSAARVLNQLAEKVSAHARYCDQALNEMVTPK